MINKSDSQSSDLYQDSIFSPPSLLTANQRLPVLSTPESLKLPPLSTWKIEQPHDQQHQTCHLPQSTTANFHLLHYDFNIKAAAKLVNNNNINSNNLFNKPNSNGKNLLNNGSSSSFDQYSIGNMSFNKLGLNDNNQNNNNNQNSSSISLSQMPPPISSRPEKTKSIVSNQLSAIGGLVKLVEFVY